MTTQYTDKQIKCPKIMCKWVASLAASCAFLGVGRCIFCMVRGRTLTPPFDTIAVILLTIGILLFDVYRLKPSSTHTWKTIISQYAVHKLIFIIGSFLHVSFKWQTKKCKTQQEALLMRIIKRNKNTKCAQKLVNNKITSVSEYVTNVPLTSYVDYGDLVNEVETLGGENVFFPEKADYLAVTSGTSGGKSKIFPKSLDIFRKYTGPWFLMEQKFLLQTLGNNLLRKTISIRTHPNFYYSKSGIKSGSIAGIAANVSLMFYVVPNEAGKLSNEDDAVYINLVFGLLEENLGNLFFSTATQGLTIFKTLEKNWKYICHDIEHGTISNLVKVPCELRNIFHQNLNGGSSERANILRKEFQRGFHAIVPRIWPECTALFCISTGTFQTAAKIIKDRYIGNVPIYSPYHVSTETAYGFNLELKRDYHSYVALVTLNFFEFIPEEEIYNDKPKTVLAHQVEVGRIYEIVVTTWEGLYRYRTEDLVEVIGFYGTVPKYKFIRRRGDILSCELEKVPEILLNSAIYLAAKSWRGKFIVDFTSVENIHVESLTGGITGRHFYVVFLEFERNGHLSSQEKHMVDEELVQLHEIYANYRKNGKLQPVRLIQVRAGTFQKVKEMTLQRNPASYSLQYKLPRIMRQDDILEYLLSVSLDVWDTDDKDV